MSESIYDCPECYSDETNSFRMIYEGGTSSESFSARSYGWRTGFIRTSGRAQSQSLLAQRTTPPQTPGLSGCAFLLCALIAALAAMNMVRFYPWIWTPIITAGIVFAGLMVGLKMILNRQKTVFKERMHQWQHSWMCLRCGHSWIAEEDE